MYVVIVGAGEVGSFLARILVDEQHDVAVIDADEKLCRDLEANLDALVVCGSGVSMETLDAAGVRRADLVIAVTQVDEVNLIACMTAAKFGRNPITIARVRDVEYLLGQSHLSASELGVSLLVGPERSVAKHVLRLLRFAGTGEVRYLADHRVVLLEMALSADSPLVQEPLSELGDTLPSPALVAAVYGEQGFRIPTGADRLEPHERVDILTVPENVDELLILSGKPWHHVRHVLIIGCGTIGFHLAKELEAQKLYPTIIENDLARAEWLSKRLAKSFVLHGDGTDPRLLREQLQEVSDAVVVLLEDDEKAMIIGSYAKHLGAKKVIVRSDKLSYGPLSHKLGIDALMSPKRALADNILRFVRRGEIEDSIMLGDHEGEILEMSVPAKPAVPELLELPLRELDFPTGVLIGAVIRGGEVALASGKTVLQPGDTVLVVTDVRSIHKVENMFR